VWSGHGVAAPLVLVSLIAAWFARAGGRGKDPRPAGPLADVPFALQWHVPTAKVITDWRLLVPAVLLAGMTVCAADGMLVNLADTWRTGVVQRAIIRR